MHAVGMPARTIFGWQKPRYLLGEGYTQVFKELMETTEWDTYGTGKYREVRRPHGALRLRADLAAHAAISNPLKALGSCARHPNVGTDGA